MTQVIGLIVAILISFQPPTSAAWAPRLRSQLVSTGATKLPLTLFAIQLALNSVWPELFFGLQNLGLPAVEIVLLGAILARILFSCFGSGRGWHGAADAVIRRG